VLVLDEPTNDLDLDTLELLEQQLVEWPGTLLLVSHDRRFLDNVVTSTIAFEGEGRLAEYVGGYEDWLRQRPQSPAAMDKPAAEIKAKPKVRKKRSFKEEREYQELPAKIAALEEEQARLHAAINEPAFYANPPDYVTAALERVTAIDEELLAALARWDALDSIG